MAAGTEVWFFWNDGTTERRMLPFAELPSRYYVPVFNRNTLLNAESDAKFLAAMHIDPLSLIDPLNFKEAEFELRGNAIHGWFYKQVRA